MKEHLRLGLKWIQQPAENMYPIIEERLNNYNMKWNLSNEELNKIYEEQKELFNIFHEEKHSVLEWHEARQVRFCLNCKMYYKTNSGDEDVNINLCSYPCCPKETKGCWRKWTDGDKLNIGL